MSKHYRTKPHAPWNHMRLSHEEQAQRERLTALIAAYEAVRHQHGREHEHAEHALGLALVRSGPFRLGDHVWQWSHAEDSIVCREAMATIHPHDMTPRGGRGI